MIGQTERLHTKDLDFEIKDVSTDSNGNIGKVSGFASTFNNRDRVGDVIKEGAFKKSLAKIKRAKRMIPLLYSHQFDKVIGGVDPKNLKETSEGLMMTDACIDLDTSLGKDCHSLLKKGYMQSFSIGFSMPNDGYACDQNGTTIKEIDLYEISVVPVPANPKAVVTEVKSVPPAKDYPIAPDDTAWDKSSAVDDIRAATGSEDSPSASYKNGFMWYDESNADSFGAYKLPYVAKVDGSLKVVPKALSAIAAVLNGGRGGVDIPSADKEKVKARVEKYYKKMGKDSPFSDNDSSKARKCARDLLESLYDSNLILRNRINN